MWQVICRCWHLLHFIPNPSNTCLALCDLWTAERKHVFEVAVLWSYVCTQLWSATNTTAEHLLLLLVVFGLTVAMKDWSISRCRVLVRNTAQALYSDCCCILTAWFLCLSGHHTHKAVSSFASLLEPSRGRAPSFWSQVHRRQARHRIADTLRHPLPPLRVNTWTEALKLAGRSLGPSPCRSTSSVWGRPICWGVANTASSPSRFRTTLLLSVLTLSVGRENWSLNPNVTSSS